MYIVYLRRGERFRELSSFNDKQSAEDLWQFLVDRRNKKRRNLIDRLRRIGLPGDQADQICYKANQGLVQVFDEDEQKFTCTCVGLSLEEAKIAIDKLRRKT